jgi:hypothetical protein
MTNIRRVILGLDIDFAGYPGWRFVDPSVQPDPGEDPLTFAWERKAHLNLFDGADSAALVAIKIGDLNESYQVQSTNPLQPREQRLLTVSSHPERPEVVRMQAIAEDLVAVQYRLALEPGVSIVEVKGLPEGLYRISEDGNAIAIALAGLETQTVFELVLSRPSSDLTLSSDFLAEAYDASGVAYSLAIEAVELSVAPTSLAGFTPNVFAVQTVLTAPAGSSLQNASLLITDALGRVLIQRELTGSEFTLTRDMLPAAQAGSLFYSIEGPELQPISGILLLAD